MKTESIGNDTWYNFYQPVGQLAEIFRISVLFAFLQCSSLIWTANFPNLRPKSVYFFDIIRGQISDLWQKLTYFFNELNFFFFKYTKFVHKSQKLTIYIKEEYCKNTILKLEEFMAIFVKIWIKTSNEKRAICSVFYERKSKKYRFLP